MSACSRIGECEPQTAVDYGNDTVTANNERRHRLGGGFFICSVSSRAEPHFPM